jgi:hypothetical protein
MKPTATRKAIIRQRELALVFDDNTTDPDHEAPADLLCITVDGRVSDALCRRIREQARRWFEEMQNQLATREVRPAFDKETK